MSYLAPYFALFKHEHYIYAKRESMWIKCESESTPLYLTSLNFSV